MRVGDRLYCKKTFSIGTDMVYKQGHFYVVSSYNGFYSQVKFDKKRIGDVVGYFFSNVKDSKHNFIGDYFCSKKELRKLKLDNLWRIDQNMK